jgi:hypothetical protein
LLLGAPASILVALIIAYLATSAQLALTFTRAERTALDQTPETYGLSYEPVRFPSRVDGVQLDGWLLQPARDSVSHRPVIIVHDKGTTVFAACTANSCLSQRGSSSMASLCLSSTCAVLGNPRVPFSHWGPTRSATSVVRSTS